MCRHCLGQILGSDHNLLVAEICTRLKKIVSFEKGNSRWDLEKFYTQQQRVQHTLEEKLGAIGCDSGNVDVQWNNINKCVLDILRDLVGKFEKSARKPWITQDMISKIGERRKWKNVNTEENRTNNRRLRNELKRATNNVKKEYLENIRNKIIKLEEQGVMI